MSRQQAISHYRRLLSRWPQDLLRPETNFQTLLKQRVEHVPKGARDEIAEVNAAYNLLNNTFSKRFPVPGSLLRPASSPDHYTNLERELEEAPKRTWFSNFAKRLQNMVRFK